MYSVFWNLYIKQFGGFRRAVVISFATVIISLLEGLNVGLLIPLLESVISRDPDSNHWISQAFERVFEVFNISFSLESILIALALLTLVVVSLKYVRANFASKTTIGFTMWLRSRMMWNMLNADLSYAHDEQLGVQAGTLVTQVQNATTTLTIMIKMVANIGIITTYLVSALLLSPILTAVALGVGVVVSLTTQYHVLRARRLGRVAVSYENEYQGEAVESLTGFYVVKSFLIEHLRWDRAEKKAADVADIRYKIAQNNNQALGIQELSLFIVIGSIIYVGIEVVSLEFSIILPLLFVLYRLMPRISTFNYDRQLLGPAMAALEVVNTTIESASKLQIVSGNVPFPGLSQGIELNGVSFSYRGGEKVLRDTSFKVEMGKLTAIVGASGAGKSTIVDLVLRHQDPLHGNITVDGVDLKDLDIRSWRSKIGLVSQDVFLFNDTIANNINISQNGATLPEIQDAAKRAYAHDFIEGLPDGYETEVGDRGWNLSGGQRQRISLARAILQSTEILILDEATSALDSESESLIKDYIRSVRGTSTVLLVAHRMSSVQDADNIVVLQDGEIVEQGTWDDLLVLSGVLANYHRIQSGE